MKKPRERLALSSTDGFGPAIHAPIVTDASRLNGVRWVQRWSDEERLYFVLQERLHNGGWHDVPVFQEIKT